VPGVARATPVRARARASREAIVQAAVALWRTQGFAGTSVTDICKAAGVSKALFYVYFARREDVLLEAEIFAMSGAHQAAQKLAEGRYELADLIAVVIQPLEQRMRKYPPELIFECVMESYRLEGRALADGASEADIAVLFLEPFQLAQRDGEIAAGVDVVRAARIAQTLASEGIRRWASTNYADKSLSKTLGKEIAQLICPK
jgi:AcrR family transcriptional regulator